MTWSRQQRHKARTARMGGHTPSTFPLLSARELVCECWVRHGQPRPHAATCPARPLHIPSDEEFDTFARHVRKRYEGAPYTDHLAELVRREAAARGFVVNVEVKDEGRRLVLTRPVELPAGDPYDLER